MKLGKHLGKKYAPVNNWVGTTLDSTIFKDRYHTTLEPTFKFKIHTKSANRSIFKSVGVICNFEIADF